MIPAASVAGGPAVIRLVDVIGASSQSMDLVSFFFFNDTATTEIYTLSLHDALPICAHPGFPLHRLAWHRRHHRRGLHKIHVQLPHRQRGFRLADRPARQFCIAHQGGRAGAPGALAVCAVGRLRRTAAPQGASLRTGEQPHQHLVPVDPRSGDARPHDRRRRGTGNPQAVARAFFGGASFSVPIRLEARTLPANYFPNFTNCLPMFFPSSMRMNAWGAFSRPSTISSRYWSRFSFNHVDSCLIPVSKRAANWLTRKPSTLACLTTSWLNHRGPVSGATELYCEICPQTATRAWVAMRRMTASVMAPPTLSK